MNKLPRENQFVAYFHFVGWTALALGVSLHLNGPHVEIHLPFGFVRVGIIERAEAFYPLGFGSNIKAWGFRERYY